MTHSHDEILAYWNTPEVESMYDKNLLRAETRLIGQHIPPDTKILDAGCGEGESALVYSSIPGSVVHAVDFSPTRLKKAEERLKGRSNVALMHVDFLGRYVLADDYDVVVSQRLLINVLEWRLQQKVLLDLMARLRPQGKLLMLEGSKQGAAALNEFRQALGLDPIPVRWHNLFLDDVALTDFMAEHHYPLEKEDGLGAYFLLTRGVRPALDKELDWDCQFNRLAAGERIARLLGLGAEFSRLKLWVFGKPNTGS